MKPSRHIETNTQRSGGFTLVELLVTVGAIILLVGVMVTGINTARKNTKKKIVQAEVRAIEMAIREYLTVYRQPPPNSSETTSMRIDRAFAEILEGANPKHQVFMQFKRKNDNGDPISPWGLDALDSYQDYYYAKFDMNFDKRVDNSLPAWDPRNPPYTRPVERDFICWGYDQSTKPADFTPRPGSPRWQQYRNSQVIGSWKGN